MARDAGSRRRLAHTLFLPVLLMSFLTGCLQGTGPDAALTAAPEPVGSCQLQLPSGANDEEAIRAVLRAEGELMVAQSITELMALWNAGSVVADAKNTPDNQDDDRQWLDKDAIRHRYVRTVFPGAPAAAQPADLAITIDGDRATVVATTNIGDEVAPAGDRWELRKVGDCWLIQSLTYNLEAPR